MRLTSMLLGRPMSELSGRQTLESEQQRRLEPPWRLIHEHSRASEDRGRNLRKGFDDERTLSATLDMR